MRIPLSAPDVTEREIAAVAEVLRTPHLSLGPKLAEFERDVAAYAGTRHAVAVNSGTSGLHLCVRALGIKAGDEVITTPFSFVASANALLYEGARPVFVDIDPLTLNLDPLKIEAAVTPRTGAIMVVHVFGRPAEMGGITALAERYGLKVIEDACEAIGAEYGGRKVGALGDAGVFAFYPNKQITTGEGGVIVTDDEQVAARARLLRNQGRDPAAGWFEHVELGYNCRLSDINCALGVEQLRRIEDILRLRESVALRYEERLKDEPRLLLPESYVAGGRVSWFVYVVRLAERFRRAQRDRVVEELREQGIGCGRYFAPIHLQPLYVRSFGYREGHFPHAERSAERAIALPFFNRITEAQQDEVCQRLVESLDGVEART
ncbi:MAG: DegT/DnrJ/EryC1/StrS family aminotransferase [Acidobacteriota bacterium]|nr:DegT/DnrJ/EryC1/StrS family aminotransferase [Acidobacteriota bacterium]